MERNGTWVNPTQDEEEWHHADFDQTDGGYADSITWNGDKNPNKTLGEGEAKAMYDKWASDGDNYNDHKYGYSKTTVSTNANGESFYYTDYYLWNK